MIYELRTLRLEEFNDFMRYLERAFGHSKEYFLRRWPQVYKPTEETCSWTYVILENKEIMSHVGLYPIETTTAGVSLNIGGIGGVSTASNVRGKGYMTKLLNHIILEMRRIGYPVSWLSGDRQRYNTFGWDLASPEYNLQFTRRSLNRYKIKPAHINEVMGDEALETLQRFYKRQDCYARRPHLERFLERTDTRFFVMDDGYAVIKGEKRDHIRILELVSVNQCEINTIQALMDWVYSDSADWNLSQWDKARLERLTQVTAYASLHYNGMYRINDLTGLLLASRQVLEVRASSLKDLTVSIGINEPDRTQITTLAIRNGVLNIYPGGYNDTYIELSPTSASRLFFGGLPIPESKALPLSLHNLLPLPVYVMPMDTV